ncbi:MAG: phosphoglucosamine mutase [Armatimonadota bacterium]
MKPLKLSMLGVRGVVGEALTPELVVDFARAFGTYVEGGLVMVSRDTRPSAEMMRSAVLSGLISTGCTVVDLGICPTPSLQLAVADCAEAVGGIAISAGHNAAEWNALKFVSGKGLLLNSHQGEELLDVFHLGQFRGAKWNELKPVQYDHDAVQRHIRRVLDVLDVERIRSAHFRVAVDCCNGACCAFTPHFLEALGCDVITINDDPNEPFPHDPEPTPRNMSQLRALVKASGADVGFAHDADGERLGLVTEDCRALPEDYTLAIIADQVLARTPGTVVCNVSTTLAMEEIAARHNSRLVRTRVGQAHVVEAMLNTGAVIGGEGSGGVVFPQVNYAHDSMASAGHILQFMAQSGKPLSALAEAVPAYHMVKQKIYCSPERVYSVLQRIRESVEEDPRGADVDLTEGIRLLWNGASVHVRASITEPLIRIIAEARNPQRAEELADLMTTRTLAYI